MKFKNGIDDDHNGYTDDILMVEFTSIKRLCGLGNLNILEY
jgi:hypothetical protein